MVVFQTTSPDSGSVRPYCNWREWYYRLVAASQPQLAGAAGAASLHAPGLVVVAEVVDTESGKTVELV